MSLVFQTEKWLKETLFDCQTCGQCILSHTRMICPMNCPKGLRNGPCGGTLDGKCEVIPEMDCVWTRIENKKGRNPPKGLHRAHPGIGVCLFLVSWIRKGRISFQLVSLPLRGVRLKA